MKLGNPMEVRASPASAAWTVLPTDYNFEYARIVPQLSDLNSNDC